MGEKVLLTGISGFIAKHVALELLNSGYEVLGTVRDINSIEITKKTLEENNASTENLSFVELDLLKDNGWDKAAEGCKYIIHVASPFPLKVSNDRESLTPAAKDGTLRVLNAGINANVEHIVKTSSIVCMYRKPNRTNPYTFGENDWTDLEWDKTTDYFVSKTRAEKAAWELMESKGIKNKLTCINPGFVLGDFLNEKSCTSMEYIKQLLQGKYPAAPKFSVMISHVKDIAKAHVLSLNNKKAEGRRLIVGSEGTLGIITEITIKLYGIPEVIAGGRVTFPSIKDATEAVIMVIQAGIPVARIELLDQEQVKACNNYSKLNLPEEPLLLLEFHGSESSVKEQSEFFSEIVADFGGNNFESTSNNEERNKLWQARWDVYYSVKALINNGRVYSTDVCLPISNITECVNYAEEQAKKFGLRAPMVGHLGDGNFHVLLPFDPENKETYKKIREFNDLLINKALELKGTITGEHGVGLHKKEYLLKEHADNIPLMKLIKRSIDQNNIMNPGKIFDLN